MATLDVFRATVAAAALGFARRALELGVMVGAVRSSSNTAARLSDLLAMALWYFNSPISRRRQPVSISSLTMRPKSSTPDGGLCCSRKRWILPVWVFGSASKVSGFFAHAINKGLQRATGDISTQFSRPESLRLLSAP
jgi:hypothetical protein